MKPEESILADALDHPASERAVFVDQACEGDGVLRDRVMALLRGYDGAGAAANARVQDASAPREYAAGTRIGRYKLMQRLAANDTAFAAGEIDARMIEIGEAADSDQLRKVRIVSDFSRDPKMGNAGKLAVSAEFERRYPTVVQRVVTTLLKSAAWISDERNRTAVLESWASSPERLAALRSVSAGPLLKERMSPLMEDNFMAGLRRDSDDAKRFGMIPADADMSFDGWVEPKYLKQALSDLRLEGYWPEYDAEGRPKADRERARH